MQMNESIINWKTWEKVLIKYNHIHLHHVIWCSNVLLDTHLNLKQFEQSENKTFTKTYILLSYSLPNNLHKSA